MARRSNTVRVGLVIGAIALGAAGTGAALAASGESPQEDVAIPESKTSFPVNERGETYGSGLEAANADVSPDLLLAIGVDGTEGYVRATDLADPAPRSPDEAALLEREGPKMIPLYESDGVTVIGEFEVGGTPDPMPDEELIPRPPAEPGR